MKSASHYLGEATAFFKNQVWGPEPPPRLDPLVDREKILKIKVDAMKPWFEQAEDGQVIDRVSEAYTLMTDKLDGYAASLSSETATAWLYTIDNYAEGSPYCDLDQLRLDECTDDYDIASKLAFDRFVKNGMDSGNFVQPLALINTYNDPRLAQQMHTVLGGSYLRPANPFFNWPRDVYDVMPAPGIQQSTLRKHLRIEHNLELRGRLRSRPNLLSVIMTGVKARRANGALYGHQDALLKQLEDISKFPPVGFQVLRRAIHGQQLPEN